MEKVLKNGLITIVCLVYQPASNAIKAPYLFNYVGHIERQYKSLLEHHQYKLLPFLYPALS
ncbi:hypothetical protein VINE108274_06745 [Vibrio neptunius]